MRIRIEDKRRAGVLGTLWGESAADFIHRAVDYYVEHNRPEIDALLQRTQRIALTTDPEQLRALVLAGDRLETAPASTDDGAARR